MRARRPSSNRRKRRFRSTPRMRASVNAAASVAMLLAGVGVPGWMTIFYPSGLTWVPVAAFGSAATVPWKPGPSWLSLLALTLNLASVLVFCGFALVSATHADIMYFGLPIAAAGAALSGWNVAHLSRAR